MSNDTHPTDPDKVSTASRLAIAATYQDPVTKALYVHKDLDQVAGPWEQEQHIPPVSVLEKFGDVESWVAYIQRWGGAATGSRLLTWSAVGLKAVLDYHGDALLGLETAEQRCTWLASHPFTKSTQWQQWLDFANGHARSQRETIERLEDLGEDIVEPSQADLLNLLRALRASVNAKADAELRPDGTTSVSFSQDKTVKGAGSVDLPPEFRIAIPVLKGHLDGDGKPVVYRLTVRLRASVGDDAKLAFRLSIPLVERVLEDVYADRVATAQALLGDSDELRLLRAAD